MKVVHGRRVMTTPSFVDHLVNAWMYFTIYGVSLPLYVIRHPVATWRLLRGVAGIDPRDEDER